MNASTRRSKRPRNSAAELSRPPADANPSATPPGSSSSLYEAAPREAAASEDSRYLSFAEVLLRNWAIATVIAAIVAFAVMLPFIVQPPRYKASSVVAVVPLGDQTNRTDLIRGVEALDRRVVVASVAAIAAASPLSSDTSLHAVVLPNTSLVRLTVEGASASRAVAVANEIPVRLAAETRRLYQVYDVAVVTPAQGSGEVVRPRLVRAAALAALAGIAAGLAAAWLIDRMRSRA